MKIKIPYTLNLLFPIIGWSIICFAFAFALIMAIAEFKDPAARHAFIVLTPVYGFLFFLLAIVRYWGLNFWSGDDVRLINKNVSPKGIAQGLSTEEVKNTFNALVAICRESVINVLASGLSIMVLTILTEWFSLASNIDLLIIFCGGAIALFLSCAFAAFFCQQALFFIVKDCRRILIERGDKTFSDINLPGIGMKFYFIFCLPFFTALTVLVAVPYFDIRVAVFCFISLSMTFIIDRVLFIYLSNALKELDRFANELPMGERAVFVTGSLDRELFDLSQSLNQASEKMYSSRRDLEKSQEEMAKRVGELEKFFELTVNREVKMMELKKELKKIKGNVQKDDD